MTKVKLFFFSFDFLLSSIDAGFKVCLPVAKGGKMVSAGIVDGKNLDQQGLVNQYGLSRKVRRHQADRELKLMFN